MNNPNMQGKIQNLMAEIQKRYNLDFVTKGVEQGATFYIFGGVLRDMVLDKPWKEVDIRVFVDASYPERDSIMEKILSDSGITVSTKIPFGEAFTVYRFVPPQSESKVDIDLSVESKHMSVNPDFTINGLYVNMTTLELIDAHGALFAIENKILKTVLDPLVQFKEEPWMIFRAVKAACQFGFAIEPATLAGMKANVHLTKEMMNTISNKSMGGLTEWLLGNMLRGLKYDPYEFVEIWNNVGITKNFIEYISEKVGVSCDAEVIKNPFEKNGVQSFEESLSLFFSEVSKTILADDSAKVFKTIIDIFEIDKPKQFEDFVVDASKIVLQYS